MKIDINDIKKLKVEDGSFLIFEYTPGAERRIIEEFRRFIKPIFIEKGIEALTIPAGLFEKIYAIEVKNKKPKIVSMK